MTRPVFVWTSGRGPFAQARRRIGGAAILPDDGVVDRLAGVAIPEDGGFALVGDADGGDVAGVMPAFFSALNGDSPLRLPDLVRIMLDPSGLRKDLAKFPCAVRRTWP